MITATALLLGLIFAVAGAQAVGPNDRRLNNSRLGISLEAPAGWTVSQHTGYADTVAVLLHPDGSRITVSAGTTTAKTPNELYLQNRPGLVAQGLVPGPLTTGVRGSVAVDLVAAKQPNKLRQLYLVREVPLARQAMVLTLASPPQAFALRQSALDHVLTRMTLEDPQPTTATGRGREATGGATPASGNGSPTSSTSPTSPASR